MLFSGACEKLELRDTNQGGRASREANDKPKRAAADDDTNTVLSAARLGLSLALSETRGLPNCHAAPLFFALIPPERAKNVCKEVVAAQLPPLSRQKVCEVRWSRSSSRLNGCGQCTNSAQRIAVMSRASDPKTCTRCFLAGVHRAFTFPCFATFQSLQLNQF